ncbi:MAG TPA: 16S rRNA (guanine(527)-N(7))-methyltransferase RsmG [Myxococcaceae bacterium]|nr:16S rRNA (guanine(527)-N(7))-methyltransferase RsmG [Myxococcaceae bacterium]
MDNESEVDALASSAGRLGLRPDAATAGRLLAFERELLAWNRRINLVSRATAAEARERHILDSLAPLPELEGAHHLLDIGSGGGLPGIPLKIARPDLEVTLVESIGKKAAFLEHVSARLGLGPGLQVRRVRAEGNPARERLPVVDAVISRAVADLPSWLLLAVRYVKPSGRVLAMLARFDESALQRAAASAGVRLAGVRRYSLPDSGAPRAVARFER